MRHGPDTVTRAGRLVVTGRDPARGPMLGRHGESRLRRWIDPEEPTLHRWLVGSPPWLAPVDASASEIDTFDPVAAR